MRSAWLSILFESYLASCCPFDPLPVKPILHRQHVERHPSHALGRKNHVFAGSNGGDKRWVLLASLIGTGKRKPWIRKPIYPYQRRTLAPTYVKSEPEGRGLTTTLTFQPYSLIKKLQFLNQYTRGRLEKVLSMLLDSFL